MADDWTDHIDLTSSADMTTCRICGDHPAADELLDHIRLTHPDVDADPETWPDGGYVIEDQTLEPDDFTEVIGDS